MSYARFSEYSDIYIHRSDNMWLCNACKLNHRYNQIFSKLSSLKQHINEHINAGHNVPTSCLEIEKEVAV